MRRLVPVALLGLLATPAVASPIAVIADRTDDIAYRTGSGATGYFGGSTRGDSIGTDFDTTGITVNRTAGANGVTFNFQISTLFDGIDQGGYTTRYADLFLRSNSTGTPAGAFDYAISLGYEQANGGLTAAGVYLNPTYKTSVDIWGGRSGYTYGGEFLQTGAAANTAAYIPTVATAGTFLTGASVTRSGASGAYTLDVTFTLSNVLAATLDDGFDVLWGTGDCGNDAVFGTVNAVPEPASFALLGSALVGVGMIHVRASRRRGQPARA